MRRIRSLALLSAVAVLAGCQTYRPTRLESLAPKNQVRATTRDGRRVELVAVTVAADSLRGLGTTQRWPWSRRDHIAIAVADLSQVEVQRLSVGRSVVAVAALATCIALPILLFSKLSEMNILGVGP